MRTIWQYSIRIANAKTMETIQEEITMDYEEAHEIFERFCIDTMCKMAEPFRFNNTKLDNPQREFMKKAQIEDYDNKDNSFNVIADCFGYDVND